MSKLMKYDIIDFDHSRYIGNTRSFWICLRTFGEGIKG
jgi:hypothetical protein